MGAAVASRDHNLAIHTADPALMCQASSANFLKRWVQS
jgi:hypothetical protein